MKVFFQFGLTLPFFSYGGSSMFSLFAAMGLVSGVKFRPKPERFHLYECAFSKIPYPPPKAGDTEFYTL